jgi:hypothetical protein
MANVIPYAFRGELFTGNHNFASGGNTFKLALYTSVTYDTSSTVYVTTNEQSSAGGSNYSAGGNTLGTNAVVSTTAVASCDFADSEWTDATISVSHAALYNSSTTPANKVCVVLDFDGTKTCTNGTFKVSFPSPATAADAIISMA